MSNLSELSKLKAKAHKLEVINIRQQARIIEIEINQKLAELDKVGRSLVEEFKIETDSTTDFNWDSLEFNELKEVPKEE